MRNSPRGSISWIFARITGIFVIPTGLWFLWFCKIALQLDVRILSAYLMDWAVVVPLILTILVQGIHSYLGVKEVIIDYIHNKYLFQFFMFLLQVLIICGGIFFVIILVRKAQFL